MNEIRIRWSLVRDKNITSQEAITVSVIEAIINSDKKISNSYLSRIMGVGRNSVSNNISSLIKKGYIFKGSKISDNEAYSILNKYDSASGCLFCGYDSVTLDEHHYPIRSVDGGKDTITLCPNCHRRFHEMTDFNRDIKINYKKVEVL